MSMEWAKAREGMVDARFLKSGPMGGGPKECYCIFWSPPKSLFCPMNFSYGPAKIIVLPLKFHLWSPANNCFVKFHFCPFKFRLWSPIWNLEEHKQCLCTILSLVQFDAIYTLLGGPIRP